MFAGTKAAPIVGGVELPLPAVTVRLALAADVFAPRLVCSAPTPNSSCISETISEGGENHATCNEVDSPSTKLIFQERVHE